MGERERDFTMILECIEGTINLFYAFVNGKRVIAGPGIGRQEWSRNVPEGEIRLKVRAIGIDEAKYNVTIDLPETANDQKLTFSLQGGYHEFEMLL